MTHSDVLKRTPLYSQHCSLNARMVEFGGWEMPVQYDGILAEYQRTRQAVTLFDISHMGEFIIEGDAEAIGLERLVTMNLSDMPLKSCRYGTMLTERGGIIDDLIVFRMEEKKWFVVVNAATTPKDVAHMSQHLAKDARFSDVSSRTGKIDVQGPLSREIVTALAPGVEALRYYTFDLFTVLGEKVLISRTGYTGELGYEIYCSWEKTPLFWEALLRDTRVTPAGLGARDILRLEMGYSLYGHELSEEITPLEAQLTRFVSGDKEFIGKVALEQQKAKGLARQVVGFVADSRRSPRAGNMLFAASGETIGIVTSGSFSPAVGRGIGLGYVMPQHAQNGTPLFFGEGDVRTGARVAPRQFYTKGSLKN